MLTLALSIGLPLAYVIVGMFISRRFWFDTRNCTISHTFMNCHYYLEGHKARCMNENSVSLRRTKTVFLVPFWPVALFTMGIAKAIFDFYHAPENKILKNRAVLKKEINDLRDVADNFEIGSVERKILFDTISVKTKELKGMQ